MNPDLEERARRAVEKARGVASPLEIADPLNAQAVAPDKVTTLTLEGTVERNAKKIGLGGGASQGQLKIAIKAGGALAGEIVLNYLNNTELAKLSKHDHRDQARKFTVTITLEEVTP